jgi:hypothetical protein
MIEKCAGVRGLVRSEFLDSHDVMAVLFTAIQSDAPRIPPGEWDWMPETRAGMTGSSR